MVFYVPRIKLLKNGVILYRWIVSARWKRRSENFRNRTKDVEKHKKWQRRPNERKKVVDFHFYYHTPYNASTQNTVHKKFRSPSYLRRVCVHLLRLIPFALFRSFFDRPLSLTLMAMTNIKGVAIFSRVNFSFGYFRFPLFGLFCLVCCFVSTLR